MLVSHRKAAIFLFETLLDRCVPMLLTPLREDAAQTPPIHDGSWPTRGLSYAAADLSTEHIGRNHAPPSGTEARAATREKHGGENSRRFPLPTFCCSARLVMLRSALEGNQKEESRRDGVRVREPRPPQETRGDN